MSAFGVLSVALVLFAVAIFDGVHMVEEGHVGVYWRAGRLLDTVAGPGLHLKVPLIDRGEAVQVTMQTDSVTDIPCGTSGGVLITFGRIEVVNRLRPDSVLRTVRDYGVNYDKMWIFDKIHHEINQFCSAHSLREVFIDQFDTLDENLGKALQVDLDKHRVGIDIVTVRVTKPRIPPALRQNFELVEAEKTNLQLTQERRKVIEEEAQTQLRRATIQAEREKLVREIEIAKEILEREGAAKMRAIDDGMHRQTERARADAAAYRILAEAKANRERLTPEFLQYTMYAAVANNSKVYFGSSIPAMFAHAPSRPPA